MLQQEQATFSGLSQVKSENGANQPQPKASEVKSESDLNQPEPNVKRQKSFTELLKSIKTIKVLPKKSK